MMRGKMAFQVTDSIFILLFFVGVMDGDTSITTDTTATGGKNSSDTSTLILNSMPGSLTILSNSTRIPNIMTRWSTILSSSDHSTSSSILEASSFISSKEALQSWITRSFYSSTNLIGMQDSTDIQKIFSTCISHSCGMSLAEHASEQSSTLHNSATELFPAVSSSEKMLIKDASSATEMMTAMSSIIPQSTEESHSAKLPVATHESSLSETLSSIHVASSGISNYVEHTTIMSDTVDPSFESSLINMTSYGVEPTFESLLIPMTISSLIQIAPSTHITEATLFNSTPPAAKVTISSGTYSESHISSFTNTLPTVKIGQSTNISSSDQLTSSHKTASTFASSTFTTINMVPLVLNNSTSAMNMAPSATPTFLSSVTYSAKTEKSVNVTSISAVSSKQATITASSKTSQTSASSSVEFMKPSTSSINSVPTDKQSTTTFVRTTIYPTLKPSAVYKFTFIFVLNGIYKDLDTSGQEDKLKDEMSQELHAKIFVGTGFTEIRILSFSEGSINCLTEVKGSVNNVSNINKSMDVILNNTVWNADSIHTTFGSCDYNKTIQSVNTSAIHYQADPKAYIVNVCPKSYEYKDEACHHVCDNTGIDLCGPKGECVFSGMENTAVCQCSEEPLYIYHGDKCEERTPKLTFYLAVTLGVGGGVVVILLITIVCLACRRERRYKGLKDTHENSSESGIPNDDIATRNLNFLFSKKDTSTDNQCCSVPCHTNKAYETLAPEDVVIPMCLQPKCHSSGSIHSDDATSGWESLKNIDTSKRYSIIRPKVSSDPNELYLTVQDISN